jgi:uncharacterized protein (DUF4415 family)
MKDEYDFSKAVHGPVFPTPPGKTRITIRLDDEVIEWFRAKVHAAGGGNYQTLMNAALREHIAREEEPLEDTLRRVLREELANGVAEKPARRRTVPAKTRTTKVATGRASNSARR